MAKWLIRNSLRITSYVFYSELIVYFVFRVFLFEDETIPEVYSYILVGTLGLWIGMLLMRELWKSSYDKSKRNNGLN